jgi:hypothetical protein
MAFTLPPNKENTMKSLKHCLLATAAAAALVLSASAQQPNASNDQQMQESEGMQHGQM